MQAVFRLVYKTPTMGTTWKFSDTTGPMQSLQNNALRRLPNDDLRELQNATNISRNLRGEVQAEHNQRRLERAGNAARSIIILDEFNPLLRPEFDRRVENLKTELYTNSSVSDEFLEHFDYKGMRGSLYLSEDIMENIDGYETVLTIAREMFKDA